MGTNPYIGIGTRTYFIGVSEVRFAKAALTHRNMWFGKRNMWFGKRKDERVEDEEPLIFGWPCGDPWYAAAAVLRCY